MTRQSALFGYLAGIIDGEGSLMIKRTIRPDCVNPCYFTRVSVKNVNEEVLKLMQKTFGGSVRQDPKIYRSVSGFAGRHRMWVYDTHDRAATRLVRSLVPYLIIKREQAHVLLKLAELKQRPHALTRTKITGYRELRGIHGQKIRMPALAYSEEHMAQCEALYEEVKRLNNR